MDYRMMVLDLDGTCITSDYKITDNLNSCIQCLKKKMSIYIATGRSLSDAYRYYRFLNMKNDIICYNGALIYNPVTKKTLRNVTLAKSSYILYYLLQNYSSFGINNIAISQKENTYFLNKNNDYMMEMLIDESLPYSFFNINNFNNIGNIHRIVVSINSKNLVTVGNILGSKFPHINIIYWHNHNDIIDITIRDTDKWEAISCLATSQNISFNEIIAFGDNNNDVNMLKNSGMGVCMLNGSDKAKQASHYITEYDNNNDGVYFFIKTKIIGENV